MSRITALVILGALVIASPFVGLPYTWLMVGEPILGGLIVLLSISIRTRQKLPRPEVPVLPE